MSKKSDKLQEVYNNIEKELTEVQFKQVTQPFGEKGKEIAQEYKELHQEMEGKLGIKSVLSSSDNGANQQLQAPHGPNVKEDILIYDVMSTPQGLDLQKVVYIFREHNIVFYDSFQGGTAPSVMNEVKHIAFIDVEGEKISKQFNNIIKDA